MPSAEAEWYNTEFHASQLAGMLPYSNCHSQGHSTLFPKCKMHSCYIPQQSRFCHSLQLFHHPIWQCQQVQSWTTGLYQGHTPHHCLDEQNHPSHLKKLKWNHIELHEFLNDISQYFNPNPSHPNTSMQVFHTIFIHFLWYLWGELV